VNTPVRRIAIAVMVMILLLLGNLTYVQVFKAGDYRTDPRNQRVLLEEYSRERGQISAGGQVLASSLATNDRLRFQRQYTGGPMYAPLTGFFSVVYNASGLEQVEDEVLNGSDDRLFVRRLSDLITGRDPSGGNVVLTIEPQVQKVAYEALMAKHYAGAVVAIRPSTGEILAMASTPSYDPTPLADHNATVQKQAWTADTQADPPVLVNRATSATYPPGSTFKLVDTAAALQDGFTPDSPLPASSQITLPGTSTRLENYAGTPCGTGPTATMADALARSCNTAYATLAEQVGEPKLRAAAEAFGIGESDDAVPLPVVPSSIGRIPDTPALMQSGIGQRDVRLTPLQNAEIVATIANGGRRMAPYLVKEIQAPDLSSLDTTSPQQLSQAIPAGVAQTMTQMMIGSENRTLGGGKITGVQIASKTGTAEHGTRPKQTPPHAWYVAFAPAQNPQVAVAVLVENGGNQALEATGGSVAAPIGRAVIASVLGSESGGTAGTGGAGR
jgi:peptidoglycan glycosyltransferase